MRRGLAVFCVWALCELNVGAETSTDPADAVATSMEAAHRLDVWRSKPALETQISLQFGGKPIFAGKLVFETGSLRSRLELVDGPVAVWDGQHAWISPPSAKFDARFHLRTWPYFIAVPMKLRDPGTKLEAMEPQPFDGAAIPAVKLSFNAGTGDTPRDWYIVHQDPETKRIRGLAYIVTFGDKEGKAEASPHSMLYADFVDVDGVPIATRMTASGWASGQGIVGQPVGEARLSSPRFVMPAADAFQKPADAREDEMPH